MTTGLEMGATVCMKASKFCPQRDRKNFLLGPKIFSPETLQALHTTGLPKLIHYLIVLLAMGNLIAQVLSAAQIP